MLKSLHLKNWYSHIDTFIEFDPHCNIIVGSTDGGKSNIIRALRKITQNRPSGDDFVSWPELNDGTGTSIELVADNGTLKWMKDKQDKYILNGTVFTAFGKDVPQEVSDFLNLSSINTQFQLDSVFLLSETPGDVASFWNRIAHLEMIDVGTANVNSAIRELTSDIKYSEGQEKVLVENLKKYDYLEQFESEVKALEDLEKQFNDLSSKENKLQELINDYYELKTDIAKWQKILTIEKPVDDLLMNFKEKNELFNRYIKLEALLDDLTDIGAKIGIQKDVLAAEKPINDLLQLYEERKTLVERQKRLSQALSSLSSIKARITAQKANYEALHKKFEDEVGEECFFCGQPIRKAI